MHARQLAHREAVIAGRAPEAFWLLEHHRVFTAGRRQVDLPASSPSLQVVRTERGGLATWHGPGQLVGYPIVSLSKRNLKVRQFISGLEAGVISWLAANGVSAARRCGYPGVWVGREKICAVGVHIRLGVSIHGFALNLTNSMEDFARIVPCGITDGGITTVSRLTKVEHPPQSVALDVARSVCEALDAPFAAR
jgi:lipoyl(octanoyl) transferase